MEKIKSNEEYKMQVACKQVYTILNLYNHELLSLRIPCNVLDNLRNNSAKDYEYNITCGNFNPDNLTEEALALLLVLFDEYFASQAQKDIINRFLNPSISINYDSSVLFKSTNNKDVPSFENKNTQECKDLIVCKSNIIKILINKIKSIFLK